jgi:CelD/BcsL family acetyltransferase involved in cellulose biosynthesis
MISVVENAEAMYNLRDDWVVLAEKQQNPLLEFEWHHSCATTVHGTDALNVLVQRDDDNAVSAIAPLVLLRKGKSTWLEFLGGSHLYEPSGMLFRDTFALQSLYRAVARTEHPVLLSRLPRGDTSLETAPRQRLQAGLWLRAKSAGTPVLELKSGWRDFYESMSSKRRYDHRRALKNATAIGETRFDAYSPVPDDVPRLLSLAFDIEDKSWKGRNGSSLKRNEKLASFFQVYATHTSSLGVLRIYFQHIADTPVAMAICIEKYDALWFLKIGYDEEYRQCSPGMILLMNIVKLCYEQKLSRIEHLGTFEPWLSPWTSHIRPHSTHIHYPGNSAGARTLCSDLFRFILSRISGKEHSNQSASH